MVYFCQGHVEFVQNVDFVVFVCLYCTVCQETVWEAFKIFLDRLPDQDQYQFWVGACVNGSVNMMDIGSFFSRSEEHSTFIRSVSLYTIMKLTFLYMVDLI